MSTTQDPIVLDDSTFNPSMNQDDQVIGDEYASNEEFQTNKWKETIVDEQPKVEKTKKAKAWGEFKRVEKNGITKMKCNHCSSLLAYPKGGTTMTLNRPLEIHCSSEPDLAPAIVNRKYDHIRMQESIAHWILMHEHSFSIVEEARFNFMMKVGIPQWPGLSRTTTKNDCVKVYENQKNKLKDMLKKVDSISLTTDMWKSKCQKIGYMEWDIENKIYCISMDNASANDKAIKNLRRIFEVDRKLLCDGRLFHVRCAAHILNLISQDGLETIKSVIKKVRDSVSFINASKHVKVEQICEILEVFNNVTHIISGSDYPTSNLFLYEVHKVKKVLDGKKDDENEFIRKMVNKMKEKFDKYWAEVHLLMAIAAVFDSLVKMWSLGFCFPKIYNPTDAKALIEMVEETLKSLHSEYVTIYNESTTQSTSPTQKSDLDVYFEDGCYMCTPEDNKSFNILDWWKNHESMYHILSKLARDILAIPITIVASEATFSAGTRLIDKYRAKLGVETV
ncbi:zinc finger BED domain-containing protein RICESLEEPER 2-like protein [Tanacetum coccineum]